ncbi:MAG: hypothetical protein KDE19_20530, partial [Caldilineaceae bacterium]|nr:hypothetical protein [Caldilineaceae bacterium]
ERSAKLLEAAGAEADDETAEAEPQLEYDVDVEAERAPEAESLVVTKPTAAENLRAALLAKQKQQPKGWKQQVKAGKMVGAHVPKRFNRGG